MPPRAQELTPPWLLTHKEFIDDGPSSQETDAPLWSLRRLLAHCTLLEREYVGVVPMEITDTITEEELFLVYCILDILPPKCLLDVQIRAARFLPARHTPTRHLATLVSDNRFFGRARSLFICDTRVKCDFELPLFRALTHPGSLIQKLAIHDAGIAENDVLTFTRGLVFAPAMTDLSISLNRLRTEAEFNWLVQDLAEKLVLPQVRIERLALAGIATTRGQLSALALALPRSAVTCLCVDGLLLLDAAPRALEPRPPIHELLAETRCFGRVLDLTIKHLALDVDALCAMLRDPRSALRSLEVTGVNITDAQLLALAEAVARSAALQQFVFGEQELYIQPETIEVS